MYVAENYPKYDYLDVINVDKVSDIPKDYDGIMGVPITFLDKYNPEQFQIVDLMNRYSVFDYFGVNNLVRQNKASCTCINGKPKFARILIRKIQ